MPTVRKRSLPVQIPLAGCSRSATGELIGSQLPYSRVGSQVTESIGHRRSKNGAFYEGGPFYTAKLEMKIPTISVVAYQNPTGLTDFNKGGRYKGPLFCGIPPNEAIVDGEFFTKFKSKPDYNGLDSYGATAISLCKPTNPNADFGIALGETLRDGVPIPGIQAWRQRTAIAKAAGSEYLNAVFGWLPLVDDMKNTAQSIKDANVILDNYQRSSGSNVRREFNFDTTRSETQAIIGTEKNASGLGPPGPAGFVSSLLLPGGQQGTMTRTTITEVRRWFSGCFTHQSYPDNSRVQNMMNVNSDTEKLFGVSLTPDLVWELTPWSWAIDWFSNAGHVVSNVGSFIQAGLIMRYGYMMEETTTRKIYSLSNAGYKSYNGPVPSSEMTLTVKRRTEANPFGFGLKWEGLSPTQLAITAALGITRLR
jgi:hypothetical protein